MLSRFLLVTSQFCIQNVQTLVGCLHLIAKEQYLLSKMFYLVAPFKKERNSSKCICTHTNQTPLKCWLKYSIQLKLYFKKNNWKTIKCKNSFWIINKNNYSLLQLKVAFWVPKVKILLSCRGHYRAASALINRVICIIYAIQAWLLIHWTNWVFLNLHT